MVERTGRKRGLLLGRPHQKRAGAAAAVERAAGLLQRRGIADRPDGATDAQLAAENLQRFGQPYRPGDEGGKGQSDHHCLDDDIGRHEHAPRRQIMRQGQFHRRRRSGLDWRTGDRLDAWLLLHGRRRCWRGSCRCSGGCGGCLDRRGSSARLLLGGRTAGRQDHGRGQRRQQAISRQQLLSSAAARISRSGLRRASARLTIKHDIASQH